MEDSHKSSPFDSMNQDEVDRRRFHRVFAFGWASTVTVSKWNQPKIPGDTKTPIGLIHIWEALHMWAENAGLGRFVSFHLLGGVSWSITFYIYMFCQFVKACRLSFFLSNKKINHHDAARWKTDQIFFVLWDARFPQDAIVKSEGLGRLGRDPIPKNCTVI